MTSRVIEPELHAADSVCRACGATLKRGNWWLKRAIWIALLLLIGLGFMSRWGGYLLVATDSLPKHVDAAVVLQGSLLGERARVKGAVELLQEGTAGRILVSIPKEMYWGQRAVPIAQAYLESLYGRDVVDRMDFCETGDEVNSTQQEAAALIACVREQGWHSIAVVTSDYHTRRAGIIWTRIAGPARPSLQFWMYGVNDPEFNAAGWWHERLWAKTWVGELVKLLWVFGDTLRHGFHVVQASFTLLPEVLS